MLSFCRPSTPTALVSYFVSGTRLNFNIHMRIDADLCSTRSLQVPGVYRTVAASDSRTSGRRYILYEAQRATSSRQFPEIIRTSKLWELEWATFSLVWNMTNTYSLRRCCDTAESFSLHILWPRWTPCSHEQLDQRTVTGNYAGSGALFIPGDVWAPPFRHQRDRRGQDGHGGQRRSCRVHGHILQIPAVGPRQTCLVSPFPIVWQKDSCLHLRLARSVATYHLILLSYTN